MVFKNTLAQSGSLGLGFLFSFLIAPLMISRLGLDKFGIWAVTGAFASYAGLLDLGVGRSLIRFVATFDAEERPRRIAECVGLGLIAVTVVGLVAAAAVAIAAPALSEALGVLDAEQMRAIGLASVAIWSLNGYQGVLNSIGLGKREMVPPNVATSVGLVVNFAFSVAALLASTSLVVYAVANAAAGVVALLPAYVAMRRLAPRPWTKVPSRELVREVLGYSVKDQVGWIADLINFQTDKIVIALVVDVRAAAIYEIASRLVIGVRSAAMMTISAMVPTAAARIVAEGREVVASMYRHYTVRSCAIAFPLFVLTAAVAPFLLVAWLGNAPGDSALLVPLLTLAFMFNISTGVGSTIALGAGHPGLVSVNAVLIAALNVVFTIALAPPFGIWGVVAGTFLALTIGSIRFTHRFLALFGLDRRDFLAAVVPTGGLAILLGVPTAALSIAVGAPSGRLPALALLALSVAAYALPYWYLATRRDFLPEKLRFPGVRRAAAIEGAA
jgi:O-antigen/teichoic acid export membrane protein